MVLRPAPFALACVAALVGCSRRADPVSPASAPHDAAPVVSVPPISTAAARAASDAGGVASQHRCPLPGRGEISDDETPSLRCASKTTPLLPWLDARGVGRKAALGFVAAHFARGSDLATAESSFGAAECYELELGDKPEPALLCEYSIPELLAERHAAVVLVRSKKPLISLDVGLTQVALDWPDQRWLDLALEVKDKGSRIELRDRAPDGTRLVSPPSRCVEREAALDQCEKDFALEPNPDVFAHALPGGEAFDYYKPLCPIERGPDKKLRIRRESLDSSVSFSPYPATIHDCADGRAQLLRSLQESASGTDRSDWRRWLAFFDKSCGQRGAWVWKDGRFVKQPP